MVHQHEVRSYKDALDPIEKSSEELRWRLSGDKGRSHNDKDDPGDRADIVKRDGAQRTARSRQDVELK
ncbi:Hypothetical predicted protein [Xyrichtys novacula]|uniref:Uncharacterized protein n=1 Tax=Xyrichtys novacula TaxID=13765 RepID=A0AAV1FSR1_XYRNO|nr:Hypothetical predicted protein [Xyrichtys novacula]